MSTSNMDDLIQVTGHIAKDAAILYTPGGKSACLALEIEPARGLPYLVVQPLGTDPSLHVAARAKARQLRRGALVTVYATHYSLHSEPSRQLLKMEGVQDVLCRDIEYRRAA